MKITIITILSLICFSVAHAEEEIPFEINSVMQEGSTYDSVLQETKDKKNERQETKKNNQQDPSAAKADITGLGQLASFNDIAVISKRFLPKTKRLELYPNFGMILNDAFFTDFDFGGRLGYYFSEKYSLELTAQWVTNTGKSVTNELQNVRYVTTTSLATPISYYGLDFKWSPVYGKMGWMNKSIVPFDIYLSAGGGLTTTNQDTRPTTLHLGIGQIFALSKWLAVRLDVSWYGYQSTTKVTTGVSSSSSTYSNLYGNLGLSMFFPEADYR